MKKVQLDLHITVPITTYAESADAVYQDLKANRQKLRVTLHNSNSIRDVQREFIRIVVEKISEVEAEVNGSSD